MASHLLLVLRTTLVGVWWACALAEAQCTAPSSLRCTRIKSTITLDADLREWQNVPGITTPLQQPYSGPIYAGGAATYKCQFSDTHLYLTMEIPGKYGFNSTSDEKCAAISTMFKIGEKATIVNMGGCPLALENQTICENLMIPDACADYRVDLGAHWELSTTSQGVEYGINVVNGTGDDGVANKDDEYSVSPTCRFDDDDAGAGNEWAGAWAHTNSSTGSNGTYIFELSRLLTTDSSLTDAQLKVGGSYSFGVAFWDPFETEEGWTDPGHYVSGCGTEFMDLVLGGEDAAPPTVAPVTGSSGAFHGTSPWLWSSLLWSTVGTWYWIS